MTTLITWQAGSERRRCDANCHYARRQRCNCICGGRYHGVGRTDETLTAEDIEATGRRVKETQGGEVTLPSLQIRLWEDNYALTEEEKARAEGHRLGEDG